jgi:3-oxoacyl-[acyl-carrier-protein] synthase-3
MADTVYINGLGSYLPGPPIANDEIEVFLGPFDDRERRIGRKALKQNGIRQRHYALDRGGKPQTTNAEMAARAAQAAVEASELTMGEIWRRRPHKATCWRLASPVWFTAR